MVLLENKSHNMPEINKQGKKKERSLSTAVRELTVLSTGAPTEPSYLIELSFKQPIFKLVGVTSEYVCIDSNNPTAASTPRVSVRKQQSAVMIIPWGAIPLFITST